MKITIENLGAEFSADIADDCALDQVLIAVRLWAATVLKGVGGVSAIGSLVPSE